MYNSRYCQLIISKNSERNKREREKKIDDYTFIEDLHIVSATIKRASLRNFKVKELRNIRGTLKFSASYHVSIQTSLVSRNTKENANIARIEKRNA